MLRWYRLSSYHVLPAIFICNEIARENVEFGLLLQYLYMYLTSCNRLIPGVES